jgi:hypothetical protein
MQQRRHRQGSVRDRLLAAGCVCYLVDMLALFRAPDFAQKIDTFVAIPSAIVELWMVGTCSMICVKTVKPDERILAVGRTLRTPSAAFLPAAAGCGMPT